MTTTGIITLIATIAPVEIPLVEGAGIDVALALGICAGMETLLWSRILYLVSSTHLISLTSTFIPV